MATSTTNPDRAVTTPLAGASVPPWPREQSASGVRFLAEPFADEKRPSQHDALQALLAFAALHDQVRRRKALAARSTAFDAHSLGALVAEFDPQEQFVLDEVLQLVAERAVAITGADGLAIALAENNEIVLRAAAGDVRPDVGARIDRDSAFSGACFRSAQIVMCDDTETDPRVNLQACRKLGARSMVAVPLCGRRRVIGLLEAFSTWPFAFNDSDVRNLSLLAELVLGALKPEDEDRFAESAQAAATKLEPAPRAATRLQRAEPPNVARVAPPVVAPGRCLWLPRRLPSFRMLWLRLLPVRPLPRPRLSWLRRPPRWCRRTGTIPRKKPAVTQPTQLRRPRSPTSSILEQPAESPPSWKKPPQPKRPLHPNSICCNPSPRAAARSC